MLNCLNPELKMKNYLTQVKPNKHEFSKVIHNHQTALITCLAVDYKIYREKLIFNLTQRNNAVTKKWTLKEGGEKTSIFFSTSFPHFKN